MDRTTPQGYGMSTFVRRYAKYINNKISSYKTLAIDLCKVKPGKDNGLRTMNMDNLCKTLPVVHNQFDSLLDFGVEAKDLNNGIIMAAFRLLYKDLNRIFVAYQEAIINLVERYFKLSRKKTREALNMYKKYLDRLDKVANFFKIVEQVGLDKSEMPDTSKLTSLLSVLEEHMAQLEAKKRGANVASPDVDDDGDEPVTPNKGSQEVAAPAKVDQSKEQPADGGHKKAPTPEPTPPPPPAATSSTSSNEPPKKAPPPARPSPIKLPKAIPQPEPKPATAPGTATQDGEKKAPPERPAKPPSRPPPPSGASPQAPAPTTQQATSTAAQSPQDSGPEPSAGEDQEQAGGETGAASATSPTRPSPTRSSQAQETNQATQSNPQQAAVANAHQANGSSSKVETGENSGESTADGSQQVGSDDASGPDDNGTTLPTCSNTVNETIHQEAQEEQLNGEAQGEQPAETNHVTNNNVANHDPAIPDEEFEPPPPPPPIEDLRLEE